MLVNIYIFLWSRLTPRETLLTTKIMIINNHLKSLRPLFYFSQKQPYLKLWKRFNVFFVCIIRHLTHSSHLTQYRLLLDLQKWLFLKNEILDFQILPPNFFEKKSQPPNFFFEKKSSPRNFFRKKVFASLFFRKESLHPPCRWSRPGYPINFDPSLKCFLFVNKISLPSQSDHDEIAWFLGTMSLKKGKYQWGVKFSFPRKKRVVKDIFSEKCRGMKFFRP